MNMFSPKSKNVTMTFQITIPYDPSQIVPVDPVETAIYNMLVDASGNNFVVTIETGTYTPQQMTKEIENKMNFAVTNYLVGTATTFTPAQVSAYKSNGGYQEFVCAFHEINRRLWIGNRSSGFVLTNTDTARFEEQSHLCLCGNNDVVPGFKHWGLPGNLGFTRCDVASSEQTDENQTRVFYGDVVSGDNGIWLTPNPVLTGASAYFVNAPLQINVRPPAYCYMDIKLLNSIDETAPYNYSRFTQETNQTNGRVKASFAKIPLLINEGHNNYYEAVNDANFYKIFTPPVERIRKLSIKLRYHNGMSVDFDNNDFTFDLELCIFRPQNNRLYNMRVPESIANNT